MDDKDCSALKGIISDPTLAVPEKVAGFIRLFNGDAGPGDPVVWNVSKEEWQRFEFLGDRVLNLVAAEQLYFRAPPSREGLMTQKMGVVSNKSLAAIAKRRGIDVDLLIPAVIGQQQTYGDAVRGGAIEACIGAIYTSIGFEETLTFIREFLAGEIDRYDPSANYIGRLQEYFQQRGLPKPIYTEIPQAGPPDKQYLFAFRVCDPEGHPLGEGIGTSKPKAKKQAAKQALEHLTPP